MQLDMTVEEVLTQIRQIHDSGEQITKRKIKQAHPTLLKNALYYYPSWEHAVRETGLNTDF